MKMPMKVSHKSNCDLLFTFSIELPLFLVKTLARKKAAQNRISRDDLSDWVEGMALSPPS